MPGFSLLTCGRLAVVKRMYALGAFFSPATLGSFLAFFSVALGTYDALALTAAASHGLRSSADSAFHCAASSDIISLAAGGLADLFSFARASLLKRM